MSRRQRLLVIFNPAAGRRRRQRLDAALRELARLGAATTLRETRAPGDAETFARETHRNTFDAIVAAGGDGTIDEVVNGMWETSPPIGLLPLGTANVLAAEIGLSDSVEHLARDLIEGPLRAVWPGIANGRRFTMMAGVGFDASVVEGVSLPLKRHIGKGAYIVEAGRCFARLQPQRYRVEIDGTAFDAAATIICRGRRYGGRYVCAPEASVFEPRFEVCLFANARRRDILRGAVNLWRGRIAGDPNVRIVRGRRVVVTGPADPVQCDGNVVCRLPAEFTLADSPIEMIAPR